MHDSGTACPQSRSLKGVLPHLPPLLGFAALVCLGGALTAGGFIKTRADGPRRDHRLAVWNAFCAGGLVAFAGIAASTFFFLASRNCFS